MISSFSLSLPGTASSLNHRDGTANEWLTSAAVVWRRSGVLTGTTMRLSTDSRQRTPLASATSSSSLFETTSTTPSYGSVYHQYPFCPTACRSEERRGGQDCVS